MDLLTVYQERKNEIQKYLDFIAGIETILPDGSPMLTGINTTTHGSVFRITPDIQKILYAGLYLQLYNIVESTVVKCVRYIESSIHQVEYSNWGKLSQNLQKEILRSLAKKIADSSIDKRTDAMYFFVQSIFTAGKNIEDNLDLGGGGNWDDEKIFNFFKRLGINISLQPEIAKNVKIKRYDDMGSLQLVKSFRNKLAHGEISFIECGANLSFKELKELTESVFTYLEEIICQINRFIDERSHIQA